MDLSRSIASLLGTPKKKRPVPRTEVDSDSRPQKKSRCDTASLDNTPPKKSRRLPASLGVNANSADCRCEAASEPSGKQVEAVTPPAPLELQRAEMTLMEKSFASLEDVLTLRARRDQRAEANSVKSDVESLLRRDFGDDRLARVLYVAGSMLDAQWKGLGTSAVLELKQRVGEQGETRPPRPEEASQRKIQFAEALRAAAAGDALSFCKLPQRPTPAGSMEAAARSMAQERHEAAAVASVTKHVPLLGGPTPSGTQRLDALRKRVLQKQDSEAEREAHRAAVDALERQMCTCEDALAVHAVVQQLFARGTGKDSAASEAEVIVAVCSESFSAQCHRPLSRESARAAMAYLERKATTWYRVEAAVHSRHAGAYLRRIPGGSSEAVRELLLNDLRELKERHSNLISKLSPAPTNGLTETACPKDVGTARQAAAGTAKASKTATAAKVGGMSQQTAVTPATRSSRRRKASCKH